MEPVDRSLVKKAVETDTLVDDLHMDCMKHRQEVSAKRLRLKYLIIATRRLLSMQGEALRKIFHKAARLKTMTLFFATLATPSGLSILLLIFFRHTLHFYAYRNTEKESSIVSKDQLQYMKSASDQVRLSNICLLDIAVG